MVNYSPDQKLVHLIYASLGTRSFKKADLVDLLRQARAKNYDLDVTGMLLYYENNFFQVIEGEESVIKKLFESIKKDERHQNIVLIIIEPIPNRAFPEWTMGFSMPDKKDLVSIEGMSDVLNEKKPFLHIQQGRARKLLDAFVQGRWRLIEH